MNPIPVQRAVAVRGPLLRRSALALAVMVALSPLAVAQSPDEEAAQLDSVVVLGSRAKGHTEGETMAPVDVIQSEELRRAGVQEVGQILQMLEPSFNFSRTFISDGTDILRPATLRALGPDQVLVLVNGKRRHQQALVNVQQTIGRGSAGTDINAIPITAIDRVEVLRDGAAAQYGSDAIAGVINIVLREDAEGVRGSFEAGQTYEDDGDVLHGGVNGGARLGDDGFINLTAEYRKRNETNRAGPDLLRVDPPRVTQRIGDADAEDAYFWLNGAVGFGAVELYWFGGVSQREGNSSGFFRSAGDSRTVPDLYPNGFLPNIITDVEDWSFAAGLRGDIGDSWNWDLSVNHGESEFIFNERKSVNVSWWYEPLPDGSGIFAESPTSAHTGTLLFDQTTLNLDFTGSVDWGVGAGPLYLATGFEYREDNYGIEAGDPVSYSYGRTNDRNIIILDQNGGIAAPGIQGFPGWTPETEVDDGRDNVALFLEAESSLTERFQLGAAVRFEDYSDFGNTTTGKLSGRFDASDSFALRGTISTGFRAPGVQQTFYSQVSTNLNSEGILTDTLTARQDSDVTRAFGIDPLKEETSTSASLGMVWRPNDRFSLTVDVFQIDIDDRIIFSSNIAPEDPSICLPDLSNCPIAQILEPFGVGQVLFFTNAIDTRTRGIDIVGEYGWEFDDGATFDLTALVHFNDTEVTARRSQSPILSPEALFDDAQVTLVEEGQPGAQHVLTGTYARDAWSVTGRGNYFGSVSGEGFTPGVKQTWSGEWLFDLSFRYEITDALSVTVGGNNIFDNYPDEWDEEEGFPFPQLGFTYCWETCPFGINGGYYYTRLDFEF
jgi:iron complex outermembrane receptor protein